MDKLLAKPDEAAVSLGISRSQTYRLIRAGTIPSVLVGRELRVPVDGLRAAIKHLQRGSDATTNEVGQ